METGFITTVTLSEFAWVLDFAPEVLRRRLELMATVDAFSRRRPRRQQHQPQYVATRVRCTYWFVNTKISTFLRPRVCV